jgi:hypothetical protein
LHTFLHTNTATQGGVAEGSQDDPLHHAQRTAHQGVLSFQRLLLAVFFFVTARRMPLK